MYAIRSYYEVDGADHSKYLWGNAAYALGARLTDAFAKYHWCAAIRGVEGGDRLGQARPRRADDARHRVMRAELRRGAHDRQNQVERFVGRSRTSFSLSTGSMSYVTLIASYNFV